MIQVLLTENQHGASDCYGSDRANNLAKIVHIALHFLSPLGQPDQKDFVPKRQLAL
jgi:hypothetical protein